MGKYLHCIDLDDILKNVNFCSRRVIESLLINQMHLNDKKPNPRNIEIPDLVDCREEHIDGIASFRMLLIYEACFKRKLTRPLTEKEKQTILKADAEIAFEDKRREINYGAPSRLSALYLVDNDEYDGRITLQNMFVKVFKRPKIIEVDVMNSFALTKVDVKWFDEYFINQDAKCIENYWTGVPFNEKHPTWEYLLEGTIAMTNIVEMHELDEHVKREMPTYYNTILEERKRIERELL